MNSDELRTTRVVVKKEYLSVLKKLRIARMRVTNIRKELDRLNRAMRELGYLEVKTKDEVPDDDSSDIAYDAWREDNVGRHVGWSDD